MLDPATDAKGPRHGQDFVDIRYHTRPGRQAGWQSLKQAGWQATRKLVGMQARWQAGTQANHPPAHPIVVPIKMCLANI